MYLEACKMFLKLALNCERDRSVLMPSCLTQAGATLDDIMDEAFAVVREASWRVLKLRHYDVQLGGGMVLHDGRFVIMIYIYIYIYIYIAMHLHLLHDHVWF